MAPVRRSTRRKRQKVASKAEEMEKGTKRQKILYETSQQQLRPALYRELLESLPLLVSRIMSNDAHLQLNSTSQLFKLLSTEDDPPIDQIVELGVVPCLVKFLTSPLLQCEAARVLKNIAAKGSETAKNILVNCGVIPLLVDLIADDSSSTDKIKQQALFALGNIAADSATFSSLILSCGALPPLLTLLNDPVNQSLLKTASWTLSNLCESTPKPQIEQLTPAIDKLVPLLILKDELVLTEACWALANLFVGGCWHDADVFSNTTCPNLIELLKHPSPTVVYPAILALASVARNDLLVQRAFLCKAHGHLLRFCGPTAADSCIAFAALSARDVIIHRALDLISEF